MSPTPTIMTLGFGSYESAATRRALPWLRDVNQPCKASGFGAREPAGARATSAAASRRRAASSLRLGPCPTPTSCAAPGEIRGLPPVRQLHDGPGDQPHGGGRPGAARPRRPWPSRRRRLDHADRGLGQHQCRLHHDRRERRRPDARGALSAARLRRCRACRSFVRRTIRGWRMRVLLAQLRTFPFRPDADIAVHQRRNRVHCHVQKCIPVA
jgi:hypothetical protein